jgi:hypothetical protein
MRVSPAAIFLVALAGCPTVDLGDDPPGTNVCRPDMAMFRDVIWPQYLAPPEADRSCVGQSGCHAIETGRSALRLEDPTDDPGAHDRNYATVTRFLNCGTPDQSSLLTKPMSGVDPHGGGDIFDDADPAVTLLTDWIMQ